MKIIDMHAHVDVLEPLNWFDTPEKLIKLMDEAGIEIAAVSAYLNLPGPDMTCMERLNASVSKYKGRLYSFIRMDPWFGDEAVEFLVKACNDYQIKGVKLHPAHYTLHPYGDLTVKLIRKAGELGLPVLFHCGDEVMCLPLQIGELAQKCPETKIILAHLGGYAHGRDALNVAKLNKNIFIDTSATPFVKEIKLMVDELGADRILFGTDAPCCDTVVELEKVRLACLTQADFEKVCYSNGAKLLGLE
jgi:predicted TIM-barrel fold metal-dependent hydrolase